MFFFRRSRQKYSFCLIDDYLQAKTFLKSNYFMLRSIFHHKIITTLHLIVNKIKIERISICRYANRFWNKLRRPTRRVHDTVKLVSIYTIITVDKQNARRMTLIEDDYNSQVNMC